jgi:hypothetical protein
MKEDKMEIQNDDPVRLVLLQSIWDLIDIYQRGESEISLDVAKSLIERVLEGDVE